MTKAQKLAATEQLARNRTVKGWAFRGLPPLEVQAIRAFLDGGPCPAGYQAMFALAREQLRLPDRWVRADADIPTWELAADPLFYVEEWGLGSWAAYEGDVRIGEPGSYGDRGEAQAAAETARHANHPATATR
jgi:hypothetical protein